MAGHDPTLLYSISDIHAYHIQQGTESSITPSGPQTMTLHMVSTSSPFADLSTTSGQNEAPEEDLYLHLHLPPELDLPLPATTQIYHKPPRSYLIPRWDLGPDSGAFIRIEFPEKATPDEIDTFELIFAQWTAFLERAAPPTGDGKHKPYNPAEWGPGGKMGGGKTEPGQLVLVDEENGSIVGELGSGAKIVEDPKLAHGSKSPVEIQMQQDGSVNVRPVSEDYLRMAQHPAYKSSTLVQNAAAASRLIVTGSGYLGSLMTGGADSFTQKTKPNPQPMTFSPATHERVRKLHAVTTSGANVSSKTVGQATKMAQNLGASVARRTMKPEKGFDRDGNPTEHYRPGFLNKSMIAFSTVADGIAESGRSLLTSSGAAATTVVGHRYGSEAEKIAANVAGGAKNVGLVYIDVTGVTRRAVIKSVAKGMVVGHVKGGGQVVVGGGDGGTIPDADIQKAAQQQGVSAGVQNNNMSAGEAHVTQFGSMRTNAPPPGYTSELGEPLGSTSERGKPPQV